MLTITRSTAMLHHMLHHLKGVYGSVVQAFIFQKVPQIPQKLAAIAI